MESLNIGDKIKDKISGLIGTVIKVSKGRDIENHGTITIKLDAACIGRFPCSPPDIEHYVEFEWWKTLQKL